MDWGHLGGKLWSPIYVKCGLRVRGGGGTGQRDRGHLQMFLMRKFYPEPPDVLPCSDSTARRGLEWGIIRCKDPLAWISRCG